MSDRCKCNWCAPCLMGWVVVLVGLLCWGLGWVVDTHQALVRDAHQWRAHVEHLKDEQTPGWRNKSEAQQ